MAPIVHEYTADANVPGASETRQAREADTGFVGNALQGLGNAVSGAGAQVQKRAAQSEITDLNAKMSQAHADFTGNLDDTLMNSDPGDKNISDDFMQDYDDKMGEISDSLTTPEAQAYFRRSNAQMRAHFQIASMHGQSLLAGQKAVDDVTGSIDNYSASLLNDPSSFDSVKNLNAMAIQASVDNEVLPQNKAEELKAQSETQFAKSAIRGWINLDPNIAKAQLQSGKWDNYLTGDLKYQLDKEADMGLHAQQIEAKRQQDAAAQQLAQQQTQTQDQFLSKLYTNGLSTKDVLHSNLDPVGSGSKEQFLKMIETAQSQKIKTDPSTFINTWNRIHLADGDPQKITDENQLNGLLGKGLTLPDIQQMRTEIQGKKTQSGQIEADLKKNFLETVKGQLTHSNPMLGMKDPQGDMQYQSFISKFLPAYDAAKKSGKDPTTLLDPTSPDYMGKMATPFVRSPQQIIHSMVTNASPQGPFAPAPTATQNAAAPASPSVAPRRPGETPSQYRQRTGK